MRCYDIITTFSQLEEMWLKESWFRKLEYFCSSERNHRISIFHLIKTAYPLWNISIFKTSVNTMNYVFKFLRFCLYLNCCSLFPGKISSLTYRWIDANLQFVSQSYIKIIFMYSFVKFVTDYNVIYLLILTILFLIRKDATFRWPTVVFPG